MSAATALTAKGEQTREHILNTALDLFTTRGYHETTMRDIAATAECSLGLTYRYFARKEDLVLALYRQMAQDLDAQVATLPRVLLSRRFKQIMHIRIAQMKPYRDMFIAILGTSLSPQNELGILGTRAADIRIQAGKLFMQLVTEASDAPPERQIRDMATVLYAAYLSLLLFWLYDRTPNQRATEELLGVAGDVLGLVRRLLRLPSVTRIIERMARAIGPILGPWN